MPLGVRHFCWPSGHKLCWLGLMALGALGCESGCDPRTGLAGSWAPGVVAVLCRSAPTPSLAAEAGTFQQAD